MWHSGIGFVKPQGALSHDRAKRAFQSGPGQKSQIAHARLLSPSNWPQRIPWLYTYIDIWNQSFTVSGKPTPLNHRVAHPQKTNMCDQHCPRPRHIYLPAFNKRLWPHQKECIHLQWSEHSLRGQKSPFLAKTTLLPLLLPLPHELGYCSTN